MLFSDAVLNSADINIVNGFEWLWSTKYISLVRPILLTDEAIKSFINADKLYRFFPNSINFSLSYVTLCRRLLPRLN